MAELSKQDVQVLIKQTENNLLSRMASKQDLLEVTQNLCTKLSTKQDLIIITDRLKDTKGTRMLTTVMEEQATLKQLMINFESLRLRLERIEARLADIDTSLERVKTLNHQINNHTRLRQLPLNGEVTE